MVQASVLVGTKEPVSIATRSDPTAVAEDDIMFDRLRPRGGWMSDCVRPVQVVHVDVRVSLGCREPSSTTTASTCKQQ